MPDAILLDTRAGREGDPTANSIGRNPFFLGRDTRYTRKGRNKSEGGRRDTGRSKKGNTSVVSLSLSLYSRVPPQCSRFRVNTHTHTRAQLRRHIYQLARATGVYFNSLFMPPSLPSVRAFLFVSPVPLSLSLSLLGIDISCP